MLTTNAYCLTALTNLHAGSGDSDFGIIDKHVQRDALTQLPTIHASSIKGAMREVFTVNGHANVTEIFGSENKGGNQNNLQQGGAIFYNALLLALPVRASKNLYYLATCPELIQDLRAHLQHFNVLGDYDSTLEELSQLAVKEGEPIYFGKGGKIQLEDLTATASDLSAAADAATVKALYGDRLAILHAQDFYNLCDELPVIARNHLENGISANLWYEEVVPRQTRFLALTADENNLVENGLAKINHHLQIGGNATVGYGFCHWKKLY